MAHLLGVDGGTESIRAIVARAAERFSTIEDGATAMVRTARTIEPERRTPGAMTRSIRSIVTSMPR